MDHAVSWTATQCDRARDAGEGTARNLLARLTELWPVGEDSYRRPDRAAMPRLLRTAGEADLVADFLHRVVMPRYDGSENEAVRDLFVLAGRFHLADQAAVAARAIVDHPDTVSPDRVLPAALAELRKYGDLARTEAYGVLWRHAADFLLARSTAPPTEPDDWTIAAESRATANSVSDCARSCPQRSLPHGGWYLIQYHLRSTFRSRENEASETTGARPCYTHALRHSLAGA